MNDPGKKPEQKWVDKSLFVVDQHYQRTVSSRRSQKVIDIIVSNFLWSRWQPPTVMPAPKGGKYIIIDGQHRITAAIKRKDIDKVPVYIIPEMSVKEAAQNFIAINRDRVPLHPLAAHRALLQMGDKQAKKIQEILDEAEIELPRHPVANGMTAPNQTQAIGTLKIGIRKYGEENVIAALMTISDAYKRTPGMLRASILSAVMSFYKTRGIKKVNRAALIRVLKKNNIVHWEATAKMAAADEGSSVHLEMIKLIVENYDDEVGA